MGGRGREGGEGEERSDKDTVQQNWLHFTVCIQTNYKLEV